MKQLHALAAALTASLMAIVPSHAQTPVQVQNEVNYLLGYIAGSGCQFFRNGSWYDAQSAHLHLRDKYKVGVARNLIQTTEQFIEGAASQSSLSGKPYMIKCGVTETTSQQWLRDKLTALRAVQ